MILHIKENYENGLEYLKLSDDGTSVIKCSKDAKGTIDIPEGVTTIKERAFVQCSLDTVNIPSTIKRIEVCAFEDCTIGNLNFNDNIRECTWTDNYFGGPFDGSSVKHLHIPKNCKIIGLQAFKGLAITNLEIPNGVTEIGPRAFSGSSLTNIVIPNSVKYLSPYAFPSVNEWTVPPELIMDIISIVKSDRYWGPYVKQNANRLINGKSLKYWEKEYKKLTGPNDILTKEQIEDLKYEIVYNTSINKSDISVKLNGGRYFVQCFVSEKGGGTITRDHLKDFTNATEVTEPSLKHCIDIIKDFCDTNNLTCGPAKPLVKTTAEKSNDVWVRVRPGFIISISNK